MTAVTDVLAGEVEEVTGAPLAPARPAVRGVRARRAMRSPSVVVSALLLLLVIGWAVVPHLFTGSDPLASNPENAFLGPGAHHLFGTDQLGRDMYARVVYGAHNTLAATAYAVLVGFLAGGVIGLVSGYVGGRVDTVVMRLIDVLLSVPTLLLCMTMVVALGYGTMNVALAVGIASIASFARVMRSEVIKVAQSEYVEAARGIGAGWPRLLVLHVLPNSVSSLLSLAALEFGTALLAVASLGFLGYGAPPPTPEWGLEVSEGRTFLATHAYLAIGPGLVIAVVVLATNRISTAAKGRRV